MTRCQLVTAWLLTALQLAIVVGMSYSIGTRISSWGILGVLEYFTYWSWMMQILFYLFTLPAWLVVANDEHGFWLRCQSGVLVLCFTPLWGIITMVFIAVVSAMLYGRNFLNNFSGGDHVLTTILTNDEV